jgi:ATP-dependent DNA helicase RecQ
MSVSEIAVERELSDRTIEGHLVEAIEAGEDVELDRLVTPEKQAAIADIMREIGDATLRPVIEQLGDGYSYAELNLVRAALRRS